AKGFQAPPSPFMSLAFGVRASISKTQTIGGIVTITRRILSLAMVVLAVAALWTPPLAAETQWGTSQPVTRTVNAWDFSPASSDLTWSISSNLHRYGTNSGYFYAGLDVPDGALILSIELEACDSSSGSQVIGELRRSTPTLAGYDTLVTVATGVAAMPLCGRYFIELPSPETVDNETYTYSLVANTGSIPQTTFGAIRMRYQLQVSPAPAVATFNDVPVSDPA